MFSPCLSCKKTMNKRFKWEVSSHLRAMQRAFIWGEERRAPLHEYQQISSKLQTGNKQKAAFFDVTLPGSWHPARGARSGAGHIWASSSWSSAHPCSQHGRPGGCHCWDATKALTVAQRLSKQMPRTVVQLGQALHLRPSAPKQSVPVNSARLASMPPYLAGGP